MKTKSVKLNAFYNAIKTCCSIIFPLITFPYISRVLLPENVGKINFGLSIISYFSLIASLGITTYAIRECAAVRNDKEKLSKVSSQIFSINICTTIIAYILLAITLIFYSKLENYRILIIVQSLSIVFTTLGADWLNSAMEDFAFITIRTVTFQIISLVLMFIFVHNPQDYMKYAIICLVSSSGASITNIWYRRRYCNINFTKNMDFKLHLAPIIYLFVMILAQTIFSNVDTSMLGIMKGDHSVGIYSTAMKMSNLISQIVSSLLWVIMPRMSYYFAEKNYEAINKMLRKVLGFNISLGFPCAVGVFCLAPEIITIIAGTEYLDAVPIMRILMISFFISLFGGSFLGNAILLPSKQEKYYMIVCCITAVFNVISNYFFIPKFGGVAAAGTTTFCSLLIFILLLFRVDRNIKLGNIFNLFIGPTVGCILIITICFLSRNIENIWIHIVVSVFGSVLVYSVSNIILKNELMIDLLGKGIGKFTKNG